MDDGFRPFQKGETLSFPKNSEKFYSIMKILKIHKANSNSTWKCFILSVFIEMDRLYSLIYSTWKISIIKTTKDEKLKVFPSKSSLVLVDFVL